jgi:hypothetical protein
MLKSQSLRIVGGTLQFMREDADVHKFVAPLCQERERVVFLIGVSESYNEGNSNSLSHPPYIAYQK